MGEHHTRQNNAGGSSQGDKPASDSRLPPDEISRRLIREHFKMADIEELRGRSVNLCWCQGELCELRDGNHWWPGKDEGAPHPR